MSNYYALQGNLGMAMAIHYFTACKYIVSIPLTDTQGYDLVIDVGNGKLRRVQAKTATNKRGSSEYYRVNLESSGVVSDFDTGLSDYLFIGTGDGAMYLIPLDNFRNKTQLTLNEKYDIFKVTIPKLDEFWNK